MNQVIKERMDFFSEKKRVSGKYYRMRLKEL